MGVLQLALLASVLAVTTCDSSRFELRADRFFLDDQPLQITSGSLHYWRIPRAYWSDRLQRARAIGINTIQTYIHWGLHEPHPGSYEWQGQAGAVHFIELAASLGLHVVLRPGPYICAETTFGGLPAWLGSSAKANVPRMRLQVQAGGRMKLRSDDRAWLQHVQTWWDQLLPRMTPLMVHNGGPILMAQLDNEYGFVDWAQDSQAYLRALKAQALKHLGPQTVLFTTDPPDIADRGSLPGDELYTVVDFGPGTDAAIAFAKQQAMNAPGQSPPFCSEFYTGWLTHWGDDMANTSAQQLADSLHRILSYANGTGSVNMYMLHGGSNTGSLAGAGIAGTEYKPQVTTYDYDAPISEAGRTGQPGIGGPNKFEMIRDVISKHTGIRPPPFPQPLLVKAHGKVALEASLPLLDALHLLSAPVPATHPLPFEEMLGQPGANHTIPESVMVYRWSSRHQRLPGGSLLNLGNPVHDYAQVLCDGTSFAGLDRSRPENATLPQQGCQQLDIVVHAMGRDSGGTKFDLKGLIHGAVTLDGKPLEGWHMFPISWPGTYPPFHELATAAPTAAMLSRGPVICRGAVHLSKTDRQGNGLHADTFVALPGWGKGLLWINQVCLGWYWPSRGPQLTHYMPGPLLQDGANSIMLLEFEAIPVRPHVILGKEPAFAAAQPQAWVQQ